ncbi:hypothetical protein [Roseibium sediminicola]|uniref:Uncharacterized protein n=1 Tax=Roseibium sediminicola TaxID=2933272 RepID=A0ABT0GUR9_9HYPH|nr:hypothetical protein [Roseibium sp. CAU 1639]MCK7613162.1 hypothetical protein [Roseibium sp. CAU 1639]
MTALLVIIGSLFAVGCLVGFYFYRADLSEEQQRIPSDQDWEPDLGEPPTEAFTHREKRAGKT